MDITRRQFVAGLTASCLLCGCQGEQKTNPESGSPPPEKATPPPGPPPAEPAPETFVVDIPAGVRAPGSWERASAKSGETFLVWKDQVGFHAVEGRCTHRKGALEYDAAKNDIHCPEHHSRFYVDGQVEVGPAKLPLKAYAVEVQGETLKLTRK